MKILHDKNINRRSDGQDVKLTQKIISDINNVGRLIYYHPGSFFQIQGVPELMLYKYSVIASLFCAFGRYFMLIIVLHI